jgi:alpha-mannosidase
MSNNPLSRREFLAAATAVGLAAATEPAEVFVVPNFHPASCGWLTTFSKERVYCLNSYLDHLDRVRDDPNYAFVLSECNNMIAMLNFKPDRFEELKKRAKEGRVELVNSFYLEPTINLSGGEALVKQGVEGLRWQEKMTGIRPRFAWTIDVCGTHDQMAQISAGLGLDAMVFTRKNPTGSTIFWAESPDGSRILSLSPGHYSEWGELFQAKQALSRAELDKLHEDAAGKLKITPTGAPVLVLAGYGDYALAPAYRAYPTELISQWKSAYPGSSVRFTTAGKYLDTILPGVQSGKLKIPTMKGGTEYDFNSFWIECPRMKWWFRRNEQGLQASEMLSTIASLEKGFAYPSQAIHNAWILTMLNMDRNSLWGSAGGMVFESDSSWDVRDRLGYVEASNHRICDSALGAIESKGDGVAYFNPLNWTRNDPVHVPAGEVPHGATAESLPGTHLVLCRVDLPSMGVAAMKAEGDAPAPTSQDLPAAIETKHYTARIDPKTGALVSLRIKPSGRELFAGPANVLVAERSQKQEGDPGDFTQNREQRKRLATSSDWAVSKVQCMRGPLATTVTVEAEFYGGKTCQRLMRFYHDYPRIDCSVDFEDLPDRTVLVSEFPLASDVEEIRRAIPYGFSHGAWSKPNPNLHGWTKGITPAVRWSDYGLAGGGGFAILDHGLSGREITGRTPLIFLYNATDKYYGYPNPWLSGKGKHHVEYAIVAHESAWAEARIPQMAWEYNHPPVSIAGAAPANARSFVKTSPNLIVEAVRREGNEIELRMAECLGLAGHASIEINLPHKGAALTDLVGKHRQALKGGPKYTFEVRPQQIVTLRLGSSPVPPVQLVTQWDEFVPKPKLAALHTYLEIKGHPPKGE